LIVASQTLITGFATGKQQERYMGWYAMMISSAQMLGPLIGGSLADAYSFRVVFAVACVVPVIPWFLSKRLDSTPKITSNAATSQKRMTPNLTNVRSILTLRGAQLAILSSFAILLTQRAYSTFFPVLLDRLGYSVSAIGLLLSLRALSSTLVRPFIANAVALFKTRLRTLLLVMAGVGVAVFGIGLSQYTALFVLFTVVIGVCGGISQPLSVLMMANAVSANERGFALGLRLMGNRLAQVTSPLVFGLVADLWRLEGAFLGAGLAAAGLATWFWTLIPKHISTGVTEPAADD
jgi:MFS family permease